MDSVRYADVEYFSAVYADAELIDGKWFFENSDGVFSRCCFSTWSNR